VSKKKGVKKAEPVQEQKVSPPVKPAKKKKPNVLLTKLAARKWYVVTGVLALLLVVSISMWAINAATVSRYKAKLSDAQAKYEAELEGVWSRITTTTGELALTKNNLADISSELESVRSDLVRLKEAKEINFGNGLKVFDIEEDGVRGKVQNISDKPMKKVFVVIAVYDEEGSLKDVRVDMIYDLNPQDVGQWYSSGEPGASYAVYAFGNKGE
jgi:hypothetical protein